MYVHPPLYMCIYPVFIHAKVQDGENCDLATLSLCQHFFRHMLHEEDTLVKIEIYRFSIHVYLTVSLDKKKLSYSSDLTFR